MKASSTELETRKLETDTTPITSRRDFTKRSMQALLTISLLDHLCSSNLLAADARLTAKKWLNEVNQIGVNVKGREMKETEWQTQIEDLLQNKIALPELLKLIDFDAIQKKVKFVNNGARSVRPKLPKIEGVPDKLVFGHQVFALKKGRSVVPHGHNNMATAFIVLKGNFHGRHYDRVADEKKPVDGTEDNAEVDVAKSPETELTPETASGTVVTEDEDAKNVTGDEAETSVPGGDTVVAEGLDTVSAGDETFPDGADTIGDQTLTSDADTVVIGDDTVTGDDSVAPGDETVTGDDTISDDAAATDASGLYDDDRIHSAGEATLLSEEATVAGPDASETPAEDTPGTRAPEPVAQQKNRRHRTQHARPDEPAQRYRIIRSDPAPKRAARLRRQHKNTDAKDSAQHSGQ